jgi:hypothetical protein
MLWMSQMGNMPRSTRASEISLTECDSFMALAVHSTSIPATHSQSSSSSTDFSSLLSKCVSCKEIRIRRSSKIRLKLKQRRQMVAKARVLARLSCQTASAQAHSTSRSIQAFPRVHLKAIKPISHAKRAPSLVSSSLSQARSCSYNSMAITDVATTSEEEGALHQSTSRDRHHDKKQAQAGVGVE